MCKQTEWDLLKKSCQLFLCFCTENEQDPHREWNTSIGKHLLTHPLVILAVTAPKLHVDRSSQAHMKYIEITYQIMNDMADSDGKSLLVPLLNSCLKVFFCPDMVVLATDNTASTTGRLTCIEHSIGETSHLRTVLDKAVTELLSPGLVRKPITPTSWRWYGCSCCCCCWCTTTEW